MSQHPQLTLPEAAEALGVHRATVNEMVLSGRLPARREGSHWLIERDDFDVFRESYRRPKHSTRTLGVTNRAEYWISEILVMIEEWSDATVAELAEVVDLVPGNIRKYLCIAEARGLAVRNEFGSWMVTSAGADAVRGLATRHDAQRAPTTVTEHEKVVRHA